MVPRDNPGKVLDDVRRVVQSVDPMQPVAFTETMEAVVSESLAPWRFTFTMLGGLAVLALLLSAIGLFAVLSYLVQERTKEIGLRIAVGAGRSNILRLVLVQSLRLAALGIGIGLVATFGLMRLVNTEDYVLRPNNPAAFVIVAIVVGMVAILSAYLPARRAASVEPMEALRTE